MNDKESYILLEKVIKMRDAQKDYFKYRGNKDLNIAKKFEKEVDELIKNFKKPNIQNTLF